MSSLKREVHLNGTLSVISLNIWIIHLYLSLVNYLFGIIRQNREWNNQRGWQNDWNLDTLFQIAVEVSQAKYLIVLNFKICLMISFSIFNWGKPVMQLIVSLADYSGFFFALSWVIPTLKLFAFSTVLLRYLEVIVSFWYTKRMI